MIRLNTLGMKAVALLAYIVFIWCALNALLSPFSLPHGVEPIIIFTFIGCCLGFFLRPRWLRWLTVCLLVLCVLQMWQGYKRGTQVRIKVERDNHSRQFVLQGRGGCAITPPKFYRDVAAFAADEGFKRKATYLGRPQEFRRDGPVRTEIYCSCWPGKVSDH